MLHLNPKALRWGVVSFLWRVSNFPVRMSGTLQFCSEKICQSKFSQYAYEYPLLWLAGELSKGIWLASGRRAWLKGLFFLIQQNLEEARECMLLHNIASIVIPIFEAELSWPDSALPKFGGQPKRARKQYYVRKQDLLIHRSKGQLYVMHYVKERVCME